MPETPTKIAFGITDLDVGGAERMLVELVVRLDRRRWDPRVYCLQPLGPLAARLADAKTPTQSFDVRSAVGALDAARRWSRELSRFQPAILQTFLFHANTIGGLAGWHARVPIRLAGHRVAEHRRNAYSWIERRLQRLSDCHVCVSDEVAWRQQEFVGLRQEQCVVIPNGVDIRAMDATPAADWAALSMPSAEVRLAFVGRLDRQKGLDLLLESLSELAGRATLVVLGAGPERQSLEASAERLGVSRWVRFLGWQAKPVQWIQAADALVLPSRWEGMPNVVLEALAAGKPVAATKVEGVSALICEGETGFLADVGSVQSLTGALIRLIDAKPDWHRIGSAGRAHVAQSFSLEQMVGRYEAVWNRLLADRKADARR